MPQLVEPKVFLIGETVFIHKGLDDYLQFLNVPWWKGTGAASDSEELIEVAGKTCYLSFSADLNKNLTKTGTRDNFEYISKGLIGTKHGSVLEHATVNLALCNVSRVFTHELVRHRQGTAFSQVSGRYVRTDVVALWVPKVIRQSEYATEIFLGAFAAMEKAVKQLETLFSIDEMKEAKQFPLKKKLTSAFRRIIGNGQANHVILTANHRALRWMIEARTSIHAEEEIRKVFVDIFNLVKDRYPSIYADATLGQVEDDIPEIVFEHSKV